MLEETNTIYWIILTSFVMPILLSIVLIWFFISYQKKKHQNELDRKDSLLREQSLIIEKQQAIENERTRIASEMHDDLGSGLTTIRYLSDKALLQAKNTDEASQIKRIADQSNTLVRNMSEIIWAMNARFDNTENLTSYLRRYASEFLDEHNLSLEFVADEEHNPVIIGGEKRRNVFLVFKEILHNTVKYSKANNIQITINSGDHYLIEIAEEASTGFDADASIQKGNGIFNCQKRMKSIGGQILFDRQIHRMKIIITVPVNNQSLV